MFPNNNAKLSNGHLDQSHVSGRAEGLLTLRKWRDMTPLAHLSFGQVMFKKAQAVDLPQLTGLRGLAALLVLFGHLKTPQGMTLDFWIADPFSKFGGFGVD